MRFVNSFEKNNKIGAGFSFADSSKRLAIVFESFGFTSLNLAIM